MVLQVDRADNEKVFISLLAAGRIEGVERCLDAGQQLPAIGPCFVLVPRKAMVKAVRIIAACLLCKRRLAGHSSCHAIQNSRPVGTIRSRYHPVDTDNHEEHDSQQPGRSSIQVKTLYLRALHDRALLANRKIQPMFTKNASLGRGYFRLLHQRNCTTAFQGRQSFITPAGPRKYRSLRHRPQYPSIATA